MDDLSRQTIKGYEFREKLNEGSFGAVYRAYQQFEQEVVVDPKNWTGTIVESRVQERENYNEQTTNIYTGIQSPGSAGSPHKP